MQKIETANQLSGRAIGAIFFAGFGAIWLSLSLYALERLHAATVSGVLLSLAVLILAAIYLLREAKRWPRVPDDPALSRAFNRVNAVQWIAIAVVVFALSRLHLDAYVMNAITAIVGLHMFPLARIFRYSPHYATGTVLVVWAAASALLEPVEHLQGIAALGTGVILWLSAAFTLALAFRNAGQSAAAPTR
jgi:hypothetical protein